MKNEARYENPVNLFISKNYDDAETAQEFIKDLAGEQLSVSKGRNGDYLYVSIEGADEDIDAFLEVYKDEYGDIVKDCGVEGWVTPEDAYYASVEGKKELLGESQKNERGNDDYLQEVWDSLEGSWDKDKFDMGKVYDSEYDCECITITSKDNEEVRAKIYIEDYEGRHPVAFNVVYRYPGDKGVGVMGTYEFQSTDMDGLGEEVFDYFDDIKQKVGESMNNESFDMSRAFFDAKKAITDWTKNQKHETLEWIYTDGRKSPTAYPSGIWDFEWDTGNGMATAEIKVSPYETRTNSWNDRLDFALKSGPEGKYMYYTSAEDVLYALDKLIRDTEFKGESKKSKSRFGKMVEGNATAYDGKYYVDIEDEDEDTLYSSDMEFDSSRKASLWAFDELEKCKDDDDVFQASVYQLFINDDGDLDHELVEVIHKSDVCESKKSEAEGPTTGDDALKQMQTGFKQYNGKTTGEIAADIRYDVATALDMPADEVDDVMQSFGLDNIYILRADGVSPKAIAQKILKANNDAKKSESDNTSWALEYLVKIAKEKGLKVSWEDANEICITVGTFPHQDHIFVTDDAPGKVDTSLELYVPVAHINTSGLTLQDVLDYLDDPIGKRDAVQFKNGNRSGKVEAKKSEGLPPKKLGSNRQYRSRADLINKMKTLDAVEITTPAQFNDIHSKQWLHTAGYAMDINGNLVGQTYFGDKDGKWYYATTKTFQGDYLPECKEEAKKSESLTLKQKELKDMARYGEAEDITTISDAEAKELKKKGIETVGISRGVYGMNGALLRDSEGNKYVITARSSNLFYFV